MLKRILLVVIAGVVIAAAVVLVLAANQPDTFRIQRATTIKAPPEKIFPLINDFGRWSEWSPWEKKDPAMKRTFSASMSGRGATYAWDGDSNVGKGSLKIAESTPPSKVALNLDFEKPFEAHNMVMFTLQPQGADTKVIWDMSGTPSFCAKIVHMFFGMDRMVGRDFEAGLSAMKAAAER